MARTEANLSCVMIVQDFLPDHWAWDDKEKNSLGDVEQMGQIIKSRLEAGGCGIAEMYAIRHNKDEKKLFNGRKNDYTISFVHDHAHFLVKFRPREGNTKTALAALIGVSPDYIEKPKRGRYSYNNMLAYLIHIKYAQKYQYPFQDVVTVAGRSYAEHYKNQHNSWMQGRAVRNQMSIKETYEMLRNEILEGRSTYYDFLPIKEYEPTLIVYGDKLKRYSDNKVALEKERKILEYRRDHPEEFPNG